MVTAFTGVCSEERPDVVVVVGDTDSTLASCLGAMRMNIPTAHVEAGLRSRDLSMPEEFNRHVVDQFSDRLYTHCADADLNLAAEGAEPARVRQVGNTMVDTLLRFRERATPPPFAAPLGLRDRGYALVTLHRPGLVDDPQRLAAMLDALQTLSTDLPVLFPLHPRTRQHLTDLGRLPDGPDEGAPRPLPGSRLYPTPPIRYLEFLHLMDHARLVLTDSGGIQEETTVLSVPCLTARDNTERPVTIEAGTNQLVGLDPPRMLAAARKILSRPFPKPLPPIPGWDGRAGERIAADLPLWLAGS
jgi:UDP-N-acetylglucosamine 2-epimerase (non-hydrolysing)